MKTFEAVYSCIAIDANIGDCKVYEAHARTWREAATQKLPKYLYPGGRRYRRVSGPTIKG